MRFVPEKYGKDNSFPRAAPYVARLRLRNTILTDPAKYSEDSSDSCKFYSVILIAATPGNRQKSKKIIINLFLWASRIFVELIQRKVLYSYYIELFWQEKKIYWTTFLFIFSYNIGSFARMKLKLFALIYPLYLICFISLKSSPSQKTVPRSTRNLRT